MCLYPKLIKNRKYLPNQKNNGKPPICTDKRLLWVPVGCQKCMECMKQKARGWQIRLLEEIKTHKRGEQHFVTLTFSNESIKELTEAIAAKHAKQNKEEPTGYELDNAVATLGIRRFLERWRAKFGTSTKHWLVTELGHNGTENIHMHGIIFTKNPEEIAKVWKYGYVWIGNYVSEATVNYTIKYCTKVDLKHKYYKPLILCSKGIGAKYTQSVNAKFNAYKPQATRETYSNRQGFKMNLPIYYRNKLYTEEQREKLWIEKIEKQERWVDGSRVSIAHGDMEYYAVLNQARAKNQRLGYGDDKINWKQHSYEQQRRELLHDERTGIDRQNNPNNEHPMARAGDMDTDKRIERARKWLSKMAGSIRNGAH